LEVIEMAELIRPNTIEITVKEDWVSDHIIGFPIMPGTLMFDLMKRLDIGIDADERGNLYAAQISRLQIINQVQPPATLRIESGQRNGQHEVKFKNGNQTVSTLQFTPAFGKLPSRDLTPPVTDKCPVSPQLLGTDWPIGEQFTFVDGIVKAEFGDGQQQATIVYTVKDGPYLWPGGWGQQYLPDYIVLESVAQGGALYMVCDPIVRGKLPVLKCFSNVKFSGDFPRLGETLVTEMHITKRSAAAGDGHFSAKIGGVIPCCDGDIKFVFIPPKKKPTDFVHPFLLLDGNNDRWNKPLCGKRALVTGGSRGVGQAIVLALTAAGVQCDFTYKTNQDGAEETLLYTRHLGKPGQAYSVNFGNLAAVKDWAITYVAKWGPVDILVNAAATGLERRYDPFDVSEGAIAHRLKIMTVNYHVPDLLSRIFGEAMTEQRFGRIINISSPGAQKALHQYPLGESKAALEALTRSFAVLFGDYGVTVNAIAPGLVDHTLAFSYTDEMVIRRALECTPGQRFVRPEDVGFKVIEICLSEALNGQVIILDHGLSVNNSPRPISFLNF
jgi:NAD(P)-dependent dehydrogenase (short-subunit alcohol dehydrogenase family)/3-hydroxymyristoyl/3-hydroxydecanoyl-(acyl carrier protein) dehydratase